MNWKQISNPKILSHIPRCWKPQEPTVLPILRACLNVVALRIILCSQSQSLFWSGLVFCDLECELLNENRELFNYRLCICACLCEVVQTKHIKLLQLGLKLNLAAGACTPNLYSRGCCTTLLSVVGMLSPACLVWYRNWPVPPQPCSVRSPVWGNASLFSFLWFLWFSFHGSGLPRGIMCRFHFSALYFCLEKCISTLCNSAGMWLGGNCIFFWVMAFVETRSLGSGFFLATDLPALGLLNVQRSVS